MPFHRRHAHGRISNKRKYTRWMATTNVCFLGSLSIIKIIMILTVLIPSWMMGLSQTINFTRHHLYMEAHMEVNLSLNKSVLFNFSHSFMTEFMLIINYQLLKSTFKTNVRSIDMWLVFHQMYFLYICYTNALTLFYMHMFTFFHSTYVVLVILFRMEECNTGFFNEILMNLQRDFRIIRNRRL